VLDNKDTNEKACRGDGKQQGQPVANLHAPEHERPQEEQPAKGVGNLPKALVEIGLLILGD
jgi:hypothetical protein